MKKGLFSVMNYYLPLKGVATMHCSANTNLEGKETALFFGLSGTGKTTLSTSSNRLLVGDDEHAWCSSGIFNLEGGCYAKVINLDKNSEPEIYKAIKRNALLENVLLDKNGNVDFTNNTLTENTRVSYPLSHLSNLTPTIGCAPHPKNVIFLTADAYGVLPPVSILNEKQFYYYFLSGYTSKIAGTERGILDPVPTFSSCFGQPFLELHPIIYADEIFKKIKSSSASVYLVNTGWDGQGKRYSIKDTRTIINAILEGKIEEDDCLILPIFNLRYPKKIDGLNSNLLDPRYSFEKKDAWKKQAIKLAKSFIHNFAKFEVFDSDRSIEKSGPVLTK